MEIFLVAYAIYWLVTNAAVDLKHAARGTTSPRWQMKLEKLRQRGLPGYKPHALTPAWFADLWLDARRAKQAKAAELLERERSAEKRLAEHVDEALDVARPTPAAPPAVGGVPADGRFHRPGGGVPADGRFHRPGAAPPEGKVVQMFPKKNGSTGMSEVTGLDPAIAHARAVAEVHALHAAEETFINGLVTAGHGATVNDLARHALVKSQEAAEAWEALASGLETNKGVQAAYAENPEAAGKDHLLGGR
jgi:hypothetical protein